MRSPSAWVFPGGPPAFARACATIRPDAAHRGPARLLARADESGRDRDVSADVGAFMKYNKIEGFDLEIQFATKFLLKDGKWALDLTRRNMKQKYNESGYSWCDADKKEELIEHGGAARFLIARKKRTHTDDSHRPMAFVHFRFTLQGEAVGVEGGQPSLYVMDIQLEPEVCAWPAPPPQTCSALPCDESF
jgi:hypothetical protein